MPANAAVFFDYVKGGAVSDLSGFTTINTFDSTAGITGTKFRIEPPSTAKFPPITTKSNFLAVLTDGSANLALPTGTSEVAFDWGSLDIYNTMRIILDDGQFFDATPGATLLSDFAPGTWGSFRIYGTEGEQFSKISFSSGYSSFEVDNLAVKAVPEPATWAMMIVGFGMTGAMLRRRKMRPVPVTA